MSKNRHFGTEVQQEVQGEKPGSRPPGPPSFLYQPRHGQLGRFGINPDQKNDTTFCNLFAFSQNALGSTTISGKLLKPVEKGSRFGNLSFVILKLTRAR